MEEALEAIMDAQIELDRASVMIEEIKNKPFWTAYECQASKEDTQIH